QKSNLFAKLALTPSFARFTIYPRTDAPLKGLWQGILRHSSGGTVMYGVVLMAALASGSSAPDWGHRCHGCSGYVGCSGCYGGYGSHGCHGSWHAGYGYGCQGGGGCYGSWG